MKKSTLIVIAVIFVASIVLISVLGMRASIMTGVIPVQKIECLNETDENAEVSIKDGKKLIEVPYEKKPISYEHEGKIVETEGVLVQLEWRVLPDNATNKAVKFIYKDTLTSITFVKDAKGSALGLIVFTKKLKLDVTIMSVDGTKVVEEVVIWVH